jgi:hypothetical protein
MRSNPMARIITGAAALTLLASSVASAQSATPPPREYGTALQTGVATNALDDVTTNELIEETAREFHVLLGGKTSGKKQGWRPVPPLPDTEGVVEAVLDLAQLETDVIVISGGDGQANAGIAGNFQSTVFVDLGQRRPCVTLDGRADPSGTCEGGSAGIPANYSAVEFRVEEGAYLAGVLAADASRRDRLGVISGTPECVECNRYIHGFINGARSVAPEIDIELAYLADSEGPGFGDPVSAATFAQAFIDVYQPDVLLPVGRNASTGMIEAACDAGILAVGTDIDVGANYPSLSDCLLTSVTRDVTRAVGESMHAFANGETRREVSYGLADGGVAVTNEWQRLPTLPVDTTEHFKTADTGLRTVQISACESDCSAAVLPELKQVPEGTDEVDGEGETSEE